MAILALNSRRNAFHLQLRFPYSAPRVATETGSGVPGGHLAAGSLVEIARRHVARAHSEREPLDIGVKTDAALKPDAVAFEDIGLPGCALAECPRHRRRDGLLP